MKPETLQSLAAFLAPAWSECGEVNVIVKPNSSFSASACSITVPEKVLFTGLTDFENYRAWRFGLWHETQHVKVNHNLLSPTEIHEHHRREQTRNLESGLSLLDLSVRNILEDYYVDIRGLQVWKGMQAERAFIQALLSSKRFPPPPPKGSLRMGLHVEYTLQVFAQLLLHGKVNADLTGWEDYSNVRNTAAYAREMLDTLVSKRPIERDARGMLDNLAHEVSVRLKLDKSSFSSPSWHPCQFDFTTLRFNVERRRLNEEVNNRIRSTRQRVETLEGNRDLVDEYKRLQHSGGKFGERGDSLVDATEHLSSRKAEASMIYVPGDINVASNDVRSLRAYVNQDALVLRMKARLRKWKTRWSEVHGTSGDELDVEAFIDDAKHSFFNEERLQVPGKVALLLDHSGSIRSFEKTYKAAVAALCEAFKLLNVNFLVLAFNQSYTRTSSSDGNDAVDNVWLIKGPNENWDDRSLARLVYVQASSHTTPLGEILAVSWPLVRKFKPEVHITLTDGLVSDMALAKQQVKKYSGAGIITLGIGIHNDAVNVARTLRILSFNSTLAVSNIQQIPDKIIKLLAKAD